MNCNVHIYLLNDHFSIEHAEAHFNGKESELNRRYEWQDELEVKDALNVNMHEKATYPLQGEFSEGESFSYDVAAMRLFEVKTNAGPTFIGCSESILDSFELNEKDDSFELKIYLKDFEPMSNPIPGIYIASQEFPKELIG